MLVIQQWIFRFDTESMSHKSKMYTLALATLKTFRPQRTLSGK